MHRKYATYQFIASQFQIQPVREICENGYGLFKHFFPLPTSTKSEKTLKEENRYFLPGSSCSISRILLHAGSLPHQAPAAPRASPVSRSCSAWWPAALSRQQLPLASLSGNTVAECPGKLPPCKQIPPANLRADF